MPELRLYLTSLILLAESGSHPSAASSKPSYSNAGDTVHPTRVQSPSERADCQALGVRYVLLPELLASSDIGTLHCPLTPDTHHLINANAIKMMKRRVMLINTSRGAVIDTKAVITGLKNGTISSLGLDVYEEEADLFFEDLSDRFIPDDVFARLLTFPNVLITGHQAFFTKEALTAIAETTIGNITAFEQTGRPLHEVHPAQFVARSDRSN